MTATHRTATSARRGLLVLLGLALLVVQPISFTIVRVLILGDPTFDGISLMSLSVMALGGLLVITNQPPRGQV